MIEAIVTNKLDDATSLQCLNSVGASNLKTGFSTESLRTKRKADLVRFGTPAVDDEIRVRFASSITLYGVAIHGHNIEPDVNVRLEESSDNFATSPTNLGTWNTQRRAGRLFGLWMKPASPLGRPDYRIRFTSLGSQVDPWEVGELVFVTSAGVISFNHFTWGFGHGHRMLNIQDETPGGSRWSYHQGELGDQLSLSWRGQSFADMEALEQLFRTAKGRHLPFTIVPFLNVTGDAKAAEKTWYVRIGSDVFETTVAHLNDRMSAMLLLEDADPLRGEAA